MADIPYLVFSLLCVILNIAPTISHANQGNSGPFSFGLWVLILNLFNFINGVLWRNDAIDRAPVLCDITSKINLIGPVGLIASNMCIIRFMAKIMRPGAVTEDRSDKRRRAIFDYTMSFAFPLLLGALSLLYQAGRYGVYKTIGCVTISALSWPTYLFMIIWPPIIVAISCGYAVFVLFHLIKHHANLRQLIKSSGSPLNLSRFLRLAALSATYLCISLPFTIIGTMATIQGIGPYIPFDWGFIHARFTKPRQFPLYERTQPVDWLVIAAGLTIFAFFSFAKESIHIYVKLLRLMRLDKIFPGLREKQNKFSGSTVAAQVSLDRSKFGVSQLTASKNGTLKSFSKEKTLDNLESNADAVPYQGPFPSIHDDVTGDNPPVEGVHVSVSKEASMV